MARDRASRPEARPLRLFVAADVPVEVRNALATSIGDWRERFPGGRWVPPENWHMTLKFLGRTWPRLVDWVLETVRVVTAEQVPFDTSVTGLGSFPSKRRARVLWAGLDDGADRFAALAGALDAALAREFETEKRAFTPHLTIARFDPPAVVEGELPAPPPAASTPFAVDRLVVYRSHLQRPVPRYEPILEAPMLGRRVG